MRVIALPNDEKKAQEIFGIFHTAVFQGEGAKDHAKARVLGKLQDALEDVAHEETGLIEGQVVKRWAPRPGVKEIRLEDAHFEMLKERVFGAGISWLPLAARRVTEAYDLLLAATEEKPGDVAAPKAPSEPEAAPPRRRKR